MDEETAAMKLSFQESKLFFANRAKKSVANTITPGKLLIKENSKVCCKILEARSLINRISFLTFVAASSS